jgi:hypothetical protein
MEEYLKQLIRKNMEKFKNKKIKMFLFRKLEIFIKINIKKNIK